MSLWRFWATHRSRVEPAEGAARPPGRRSLGGVEHSLAVIALVIGASACAAYRPPPIPPDHPANPQAAAAPPPAASTVLQQTAPQPAAPAASEEMPGHAGHDMHMHGGH